MRKLIGTLALAASSIGVPAAAQVVVPGPEPIEFTEPGKKRTEPALTRTGPTPQPAKTYWYVGGEFGAMIVEDMNVDVGASNNAITVNHEYGYDGGLFVGYDFGAFRLEAEVAHKKADLDDYQTSIRLPLEGPNFAAGREASGNTTAMSFMINGMLDFGDDDGISGFVGGGVGMARVKANNYRNFSNATPFLDGSDSGLAWQAFAGVRQKVGDNIDVTVKYRFFNASKVEMVAFNGQQTEHRFRSHSLLGGITFKFRKPRRPVVETYCLDGWVLNSERQCESTGPSVTEWECPPDKTRYATKPVCPGSEYGPAFIFFAWDQPRPETPEDARLSDEAKQILDEVAKEYGRTGQAKVTLEAHTDRSGPDEWNNGLARRRLDAVRAYLAEKGIPAPTAVLTGESYGERCRRLETADGVAEVMNRRVELFLGPREYTPPTRCPPPGASR